MKHTSFFLKALFFAVVSCILFSCSEPKVGDEWEYHTIQSYGYVYMKLDKFKAQQMSEGCIMIEYCQTLERVCAFNKNIELWGQYGEAHGDTAYNHLEAFRVAANGFLSSPTHNIFFAFDIDSILVVSDADFDEDHPEGTSLNDIIRFVALSPMEFIRNGYSSSYDLVLPNDTIGIVKALVSQGYGYGCKDFSIVEKTLKDCTPNDFMMISFARNSDSNNKLTSPMCVLQFLSRPTLETEHNITIQIFGTDHIEQSSHEISCKLTF